MARKGSTPKGQVRTQQENDRYNEWQKQHRERTDNVRQRAYMRTSTRAARWVRENMPDLWEQWFEEELAALIASEETEPYCRHEHTVEVGVTMKCLDCAELLTIKTADREKEIA